MLLYLLLWFKKECDIRISNKIAVCAQGDAPDI